VRFGLGCFCLRRALSIPFDSVCDAVTSFYSRQGLVTRSVQEEEAHGGEGQAWADDAVWRVLEQLCECIKHSEQKLAASFFGSKTVTGSVASLEEGRVVEFGEFRALMRAVRGDEVGDASVERAFVRLSNPADNRIICSDFIREVRRLDVRGDHGMLGGDADEMGEGEGLEEVLERYRLESGGVGEGCDWGRDAEGGQRTGARLAMWLPQPDIQDDGVHDSGGGSQDPAE